MERLLFRNLRPLYGWLFIVAWFAILVLMTWVFLRDSGISQEPFRALTIAFFWGLGCWLAFGALTRPIVSVRQKSDGSWIVIRRWPWTHDEERIDPDRLPAPTIDAESDGEGGMHYRCLLKTPEHGPVEFSEHLKLDNAALARDRMALLIRSARTRTPRNTPPLPGSR